jgi:hypothetical protein
MDTAIDVHALERIHPLAVVTVAEVSASIEIARDIAKREERKLEVRASLSVDRSGLPEDSGENERAMDEDADPGPHHVNSERLMRGSMLRHRDEFTELESRLRHD